MTQPLSFDADGVQFAWDATSIENYDKCPRYYYYTNIEGYRPSNKSVHLLFGGFYATALEHFYKHLADGMSFEDAQAEIVWEALRSTWLRLEIDGKVRGGPMAFESSEKTRANLIRTIIWYTEFFREDPMNVVHLANGKPAVELSFSLNVDNGVVLCGHLDRVVEYGGAAYVMDQKTTGQSLSQYYFNQWDTSMQMSLYSFAGGAILNAPVKGVVIDAAQIAGGFSRFMRGFTLRTDLQLQEWYDEAMHKIEEARHYTREQHFPRRTASCGNYGGCPFRSVCGSDPRVRPNILAGDFVREARWDPIQRR
jgi:RecB family exonuclease